MLTHSQIKKARKLQYWVEGRTQGTYFGCKIGGAPDCCYETPEDCRDKEKEGDLEKDVERG